MTKMMFSDSFFQEVKELKELYFENKVMVWGFVFPLIAIVVFSSFATSVAIAGFAVLMFIKNNKFKEAWLVVGAYLSLWASLFIGVLCIAGLALI